VPRVARLFLAVIALAGLPLAAFGLYRALRGEHGGGLSADLGYALAVATAWMLVGALARKVSARGRRVCVAIGLVIVAVGWLPLTSLPLPIRLAAALVVGWAPLLGGLYQALG
jgi:hypothetical protein